MSPQPIYIRTVTYPHLYVASIHGVLYLTWVTEKDKEHALVFPPFDEIERWYEVLSNLTKIPLEAVYANGELV